MAKAIVETFEAEVAPPRLALGRDVVSKLGVGVGPYQCSRLWNSATCSGKYKVHFPVPVESGPPLRFSDLTLAVL